MVRKIRFSITSPSSYQQLNAATNLKNQPIKTEPSEPQEPQSKKSSNKVWTALSKNLRDNDNQPEKKNHWPGHLDERAQKISEADYYNVNFGDNQHQPQPTTLGATGLPPPNFTSAQPPQIKTGSWQNLNPLQDEDADALDNEKIAPPSEKIKRGFQPLKNRNFEQNQGMIYQEKDKIDGCDWDESDDKAEFLDPPSKISVLEHVETLPQIVGSELPVGNGARQEPALNSNNDASIPPTPITTPGQPVVSSAPSGPSGIPPPQFKTPHLWDDSKPNFKNKNWDDNLEGEKYAKMKTYNIKEALNVDTEEFEKNKFLRTAKGKDGRKIVALDKDVDLHKVSLKRDGDLNYSNLEELASQSTALEDEKQKELDQDRKEAKSSSKESETNMDALKDFRNIIATHAKSHYPDQPVGKFMGGLGKEKKSPSKPSDSPNKKHKNQVSLLPDPPTHERKTGYRGKHYDPSYERPPIPYYEPDPKYMTKSVKPSIPASTPAPANQSKYLNDNYGFNQQTNAAYGKQGYSTESYQSAHNTASYDQQDYYQHGPTQNQYNHVKQEAYQEDPYTSTNGNTWNKQNTAPTTVKTGYQPKLPHPPPKWTPPVKKNSCSNVPLTKEQRIALEQSNKRRALGLPSNNINVNVKQENFETPSYMNPEKNQNKDAFGSCPFKMGEQSDLHVMVDEPKPEVKKEAAVADVNNRKRPQPNIKHKNKWLKLNIGMEIFFHNLRNKITRRLT